MKDFKNSETALNLMRAFAGESQARNRYTLGAELARKQKLPGIEAIFRYTADQEKEHGEIFYQYLEPLDRQSVVIQAGYPVDLEQNTLAQLQAAARNEFEEHDQVYRQFAQKAMEEGYPQISASFQMIAQIEKTHGQRFQYLAERLEQGRLYLSQTETAWVCLNCGHIHYGTQAPQACPVCRHEQGYFVPMEMAPWALKK